MYDIRYSRSKSTRFVFLEFFFFLNSSWIMLDGGKKCDVLMFEIPVYVEIIGEWFTGEAGFRKIPGNRGVLHFERIDRYFTGAGSNCERLKSFILKHDAVYLRWIWCIRVRSRGSGRGMDRVDLQRDRRFENEKSFFHRRKKGKRRIIKWFVDEIKCERERDVESEDETWQFWTVLLPRYSLRRDTRRD